MDADNNVVGFVNRYQKLEDYGLTELDGTIYNYKPAMRMVFDSCGREIEVIDSKSKYFTSITGVEYSTSHVPYYLIYNSTDVIATHELAANNYRLLDSGVACLADDTRSVDGRLYHVDQVESLFFKDEVTGDYYKVKIVLESDNADLFGDTRYFSNQTDMLFDLLGESRRYQDTPYIIVSASEAHILGSMDISVVRAEGSMYVVRSASIRSYIGRSIYPTTRLNRILEVLGCAKRVRHFATK
jgi:hypothetical protein